MERLDIMEEKLIDLWMCYLTEKHKLDRDNARRLIEDITLRDLEGVRKEIRDAEEALATLTKSDRFYKWFEDELYELRTLEIHYLMKKRAGITSMYEFYGEDEL